MTHPFLLTTPNQATFGYDGTIKAPILLSFLDESRFICRIHVENRVCVIIMIVSLSSIHDEELIYTL